MSYILGFKTGLGEVFVLHLQFEDYTMIFYYADPR